MNLAARVFLVIATLSLACAGAPTNAVAQTQPAPGQADETRIGFDVLGGFPFTPPAYDPAKPDDPVGPRVDEQIPSAVRKLNGAKVAVTGFMLPTRMEGGRVMEFLLLRDQAMCCFGAQPQMNEWIVVRMAKPGAYLPDVPKSFAGTLKVGAIEENGYLSGIYLLENARAVK